MTRQRGYVRQRASGRWYASLSVSDSATSKRTRPSIGPFATKADANAALTRALAERDAGTYVVPSAEPLGRFLATWLESRRHDLRPSTLHGYRGVVDRYTSDIAGIALRDLTARHLQALYGRMLDAGLSARTVRTLHVVLHRALADAVRWDVLARNPADAVRPPRLAPTEMATWDAGALSAFLAVASDAADPGTFVAVYLAATTGMRRAEVCGLAWDHIDLDAATLRVVRTRTSVGGTVREGPPKTAKGRRVIDLDASTVALLRRWKLAQDPSPDVVTQHPETLSDRFDALVRDFRAERPDVPRLRLHDLRHTAASLMLAGGIPVHVVAARLGHSTPVITLSVYAHVLPSQGSQAAAVMGDAVAQAVAERGSSRSLGDDGQARDATVERI